MCNPLCDKRPTSRGTAVAQFQLSVVHSGNGLVYWSAATDPKDSLWYCFLIVTGSWKTYLLGTGIYYVTAIPCALILSTKNSW